LVRRRELDSRRRVNSNRSPLFILNATVFQPMTKTPLTKTSHLLSSLLLLGITYATLAQNPPARIAMGERSWPTFWRQFTVAINKKDHAALLRMMPNDFFDGGGGLTPKEWLRFIDENERNGSWRDFRRSVARGTKINRDWSSKGVPTKVTRDNGYYFEFRKDAKWYFAGVVGD
jgi:hypothetical protein